MFYLTHPRHVTRVLRQFDAGRQTAVEWEEIEELLGSAVVG